METFFIFSLFSIVFHTFISILSPFSLFLLSASPFHFSLYSKDLFHPSPILCLTTPLSQYLIPFSFSLLFYSHTSLHQCMISTQFPSHFGLLTSFVYLTTSVSQPPLLIHFIFSYISSLRVSIPFPPSRFYCLSFLLCIFLNLFLLFLVFPFLVSASIVLFLQSLFSVSFFLLFVSPFLVSQFLFSCV